MPKPLMPNELKQLLIEFKRTRGGYYSLSQLGYFGSHARQAATADSDVDIVFDTDAPNLFMTVMMKEDLEAVLGRAVDLLQLRGLTNQRLKARIDREAVYV